MKYEIKAELDLRLGDESLFPGSCEFHLGATLADESIPLLTGSIDPPCLEGNALKQLFSAITQFD